MERLEGMFREEVRPTKEVSEAYKKRVIKEKRDRIIEASRMERYCNVNKDKIADALKVNVEDDAYFYGKSYDDILALDLVKYYNEAPVKNDDGFVTIMSYEEDRHRNYYISAMKALYMLVKSKAKANTIRFQTELYNEFNWDVEPCNNIPGRRFKNGVVHMKKIITSSTHHDYLIVFGENNIGQRYISYRIMTRVPNDKFYK